MFAASEFSDRDEMQVDVGRSGDVSGLSVRRLDARLAAGQEANVDRVVRSLQGLFESSNNDGQRESVLDLWGIARPASERAQRALADTVYIALLGKDKDAVRLGLTHFDLVQHMAGAPRDRVRKGLLDAMQGNQKLAKRADAKMRQAGWIRRKKKWWDKG